jgi:molecular chaperone GrpE (heat shock protein)
VSTGTAAPAVPDLSAVFHRLNNQLGIILANAELLEARLADETQRARASQVVSGALEAISTIQDLRRVLGVRPNLGPNESR